MMVLKTSVAASFVCLVILFGEHVDQGLTALSLSP